MIIKEVTHYLEEIAPLHLQESYDNAGLLTGQDHQKIEGILLTLDCTEEIVQEAIETGCNLIIAHHPIVFKGLKKFNGNNYVERTIIKAIKNDIAIYASHTNLDAVMVGVNKKIADKIGLNNLSLLSNHPKHENTGIGMIGDLSQKMTYIDFLGHLKQSMNLNTIRHTQLLDKKIEKVAICGGSGSFLLQTAIKKQADVFVTADFKYHEFFDAENHLMIADIGHYESEIFTKDLFLELLRKKFPSIALYLSKLNTNPISYFS